MAERTKLVGVNHVAIEVGDVDEALEFYGRIFDFDLRGVERHGRMAFIDMGDQFLALSQGRTQPPDEHRHFGLVVEDKAAAIAAAREAGVELFGKGNDFRDPWGNFVQIVEYSEIQFTKAPEVLSGMGLSDLEKSGRAVEELRAKGLIP
jgi:lactoylglutathione lyase